MDTDTGMHQNQHNNQQFKIQHNNHLHNQHQTQHNNQQFKIQHNNNHKQSKDIKEVENKETKNS
ncbi:protein of unknown function, DUF4106 family [Trichomonas vaginalis G3]|uniref:protein of unknown function, DUF4106 family n=1 Tax=Trichomonas vaginalis (strain ATCC PRA-98 / G3) TaxID=412133 RepID=UPI0021E5924F|nr:protein of unknown function, DUF4106 family [Trichomonas vaginalis G3]KAI5539899.1 protein of unknown function, DUF4106 family [Trichomonas vaginalis G3]